MKVRTDGGGGGGIPVDDGGDDDSGFIMISPNDTQMNSTCIWTIPCSENPNRSRYWAPRNPQVEMLYPEMVE